MVAVINHKSSLTAIDADVLTSDESSFIGCQKQYHIGNIQRIAHTACGLLNGIGAFVNGVCSVDPTGRNGVDPNLSGKRNCQGVCQC